MNLPLDPELTVIVCPRVTKPLLFPDNQLGLCRVCGSSVQHRPHIPRPSQLACMECFVAIAQPDDRIVVTDETVRDIKAWGKEHGN